MLLHVVHNFVLCFYRKDLFLLCYQEFLLDENCLVDMGTSCALTLTWGLFVNGVIFLKTRVQYTYIVSCTVTEITCAGITFVYLIYKILYYSMKLLV